MNCQKFESIVHDLTKQQVLDKSAREEALAHSDRCERCAQRLNDERKLTFALNTLAAETRFVPASPQVEEHLRQALLNHTLSRNTQATSRRGYWIGAAAAVLLILFGIAGLRLTWERSAGQESGSIATAGSTTPANDQGPVVEPTGVVDPWNHQVRRSSIRTHFKTGRKGTSNRVRSSAPVRSGTAAIVSNTEKEIVTGFMPVGLTPLNFQEGGQIVRVELSRSAMLSFGLPVNMERYGERVKADVLMGTDGLARAIRFVQ